MPKRKEPTPNEQYSGVVKLRSAGEAIVITIPKTVLAAMQWTKGEHIIVTAVQSTKTRKGAMTAVPVAEKR